MIVKIFVEIFRGIPVDTSFPQKLFFLKKSWRAYLEDFLNESQEKLTNKYNEVFLGGSQ